MTISSPESVFAVPGPQPWGAVPGTPISEGSEGVASNASDAQQPVPTTKEGEPGREVQWVNTELHAIASTIEELQSRLEEANFRLSSVEKVETTEVEIGRLFVEAQRFSDAWLSKLEYKIHEVLGEAEAKAQQILEEATEEAHEIRRSAQQAAFASTRTVQELQSAIVGFTTVNSELLKELGTLNSMLTSGNDRQGSDHHLPSQAELHSTEQD
jgi:prefoldin subunit 5